MKLDKIKFARLISYIQALTNRPYDEFEIGQIDTMIDLNLPPVAVGIVPAKAVDELLAAMQAGHNAGFIPAIKAYRAITGAGLKEAKDAIEKFSG